MTVTPINAAGQPVDMLRADMTYGITAALGPAGSAPVTPIVKLNQLSDDENDLVSRLVDKITNRRYLLELRDAYYNGTFRLVDLGISIPPQMRTLKVALGWARTCVDYLNARLNLQGFRYPSGTDVDLDLQDIWLGNRMDSESQMANLDALVFGVSYVAVGSNEDDSNLPIMTVESPLDVAMHWDARKRRATAALRLFEHHGTRAATLYLPKQTVSLEQGPNGWTVTDRDQHNAGQVLMQRIVNRARSYDREGYSEITPELMAVTDSACRTLLGLEVAREFYSAPQRYILGADESAFVGSDGKPKSGWETYLGRVLALERDPEGNVPTVGQFTPYNPATYTQIIDMYARVVSSMTGLPPHVLGFTTDNPASADAIRNSENGLVMKADHKCVTFGADWVGAMQLALLVRDGGQLSDDARRMAAEWAATATPTPGATTDAVFKQVSMGYLPATSDVTGALLGYSPIERQRIDQDRAHDQGASFLNEIAHSIGAKDARVDNSLANVVSGRGGAAPGAAGSPQAPAGGPAAGPVTGGTPTGA